MKLESMMEHQKSQVSVRDKPWYGTLLDIVGERHILDGFTDRLAYGRDRWPFANLEYRFGKIPIVLPELIVFPGNTEEVRAVLKVSNKYKVPVIPYGFGSGVLGGAIPLGPAITVDLKRLNRLVAIDEISGLATAQAGMNGELFEAALNKRKFTLGHFPQSLNISTLGGWLSCRSAGQASSRYGKIEDMVVGLKAILADGREVDVRPAPRRSVGPSIIDLFVGAEGVFGIIVEGTFRILPYPEREAVYAIGFKDYSTGLEAFRKIMHAELRPAIVRLYDEHESRSKIAEFPEYSKHPCLAMLTFSGRKELVEVEKRMAIKICRDLGGVEGSAEPAYRWMQHRFESLSAKQIFEEKMMDTIEVAGSWKALPEMYEGMKAAVLSVAPEVHFGAHWSHVYTDGACMYMTFIIPASNDEKAAQQQSLIWDETMKACLKAGGTIGHHHGIGYYRSKWIKDELGAGHEILQSIKDVIDPNHIMNPGKLALR